MTLTDEQVDALREWSACCMSEAKSYPLWQMRELAKSMSETDMLSDYIKSTGDANLEELGDGSW